MASKEFRSRGSVVPRELRKQRIPPDRLLSAVLLAHRLAPPELPTLIHYDYDITAASVRGTLIVCALIKHHAHRWRQRPWIRRYTSNAGPAS
jgi:hypothetical protein